MKYKITTFFFLTLILCGCYPESLKYEIGIGTRSIHGNIKVEDGEILKSDSFILIVEYYSRFIQFENESPIYTPKARIVSPIKNKDFYISFDMKATSIELAFIASGYNIHRFYFKRQTS